MRIGIFIEREQALEEKAGGREGLESFSIEASPPDELVLSELHRRFDLQWRDGELVNNKSGVVLAYLAAIGAITLSLCEDIAPGWKQHSVLVIVLSGLSLASYVAAIVSSIQTLRSRPFYAPLGVEGEELEFYLEKDRSNLILQIISQYSHYIGENSAQLEAKWKWLVRSIALVAVFTILLTATILAVNLV